MGFSLIISIFSSGTESSAGGSIKMSSISKYLKSGCQLATKGTEIFFSFKKIFH